MLKKIRYILTATEKKRVVLLTVGTVFLSISETFSVGIVIPILGLFANQEKIHSSKIVHWFYQLIGSHDNKSFLTILIIAAIVLFLLKSAYSLFILYCQQYIISAIRRRIKEEVLLAYLKKPYSFHLDNNSSVLFKNVITEVAEFSVGFLSSLMIILSELMIISGICFLLILVYPMMTITIIALLAGIFLFFNTFLKSRIKAAAHEREKYSEQKFKTALEALRAVKEIQVHNVHKFFAEKFSAAVGSYLRGLIKYNITAILPRYTIETLLFISMMAGILFSTYTGKASADLLPIMGVLGVASLRVLPSINRIYGDINSLQYHKNSLDIVYKIIKENELCVSSGTVDDVSANPIHSPSKLQLRNITFSYGALLSPIFKGFDLVIPANMTVAIVGESGSGKSTLIDILMGLLLPSEGALLYRDKVINGDNVAAYRKRIGYVPQQIFLADDTIEANIAFGMTPDRIDHGRIKEVLRIAQLEEFINGLPEGTKTAVGERGVKLSGGQRQRIGIARAMYHRPEILILDEATSALDGFTESEITRALKVLKGHMTILIVAHRLSSIEHSDLIYVLEKGKVMDTGSFVELMGKSRVFRRLSQRKDLSERGNDHHHTVI